MMRLLTCICVLTVGALFASAMSARPPSKSVDQTDELTVFLTGNDRGALKPCGCSGGQLGGLDRRAAVFKSVPASKRLIVDTGLLAEGDREQDQIKFNIMIQAFSLLDYDLVNLTEEDIAIAQKLGLLESLGSLFNVINSQELADSGLPAKFTRRLSLQGREVEVTVAAFDAKSRPIGDVEALFAGESGRKRVNILIVNECGGDIRVSVEKMGVVDCLVCPAGSDEARVIGDPNDGQLVVSAGRYGKYVGRLQIRFDESGEKLKFKFSVVPVSEDLEQEEAQVELYKVYQQLVKDAGLLEKQPRFVLPEGLKYTGSGSCASCHSYEYEKWSTKAHAHAYETLAKVGSQYDPECVTCHVVGFEYESGFVSEEKTGYLKDVGCENCHGPGSEHIKTGGESLTSGPMSDCVNCHTPEQSADYAGNEQIYFQKIIHWGEPNRSCDVKE